MSGENCENVYIKWEKSGTESSPKFGGARILYKTDVNYYFCTIFIWVLETFCDIKSFGILCVFSKVLSIKFQENYYHQIFASARLF